VLSRVELLLWYLIIDSFLPALMEVVSRGKDSNPIMALFIVSMRKRLAEAIAMLRIVVGSKNSGFNVTKTDYYGY
jgi:hypothetical protein